LISTSSAGSIFTKLHLPHDDDSGDRRVLAVLAFLRG
jgi:hypothetical protein